MYFFFVTLISSFSFLFANGQVSPLEMWKLENPTSTFASESNKFTLAYDVHNDINEDNVRVKIFTADCQNPVDGTSAIEVSDGITVEKMGASDSKGIFEFALDIPKLVKNDDVFDSSNPDKQMIKLCARYMLWTPGWTYEVNFIESILILYFDLKDTEFTYSGFVSKEFDLFGQAMS
jgi:hypothetical protein